MLKLFGHLHSNMSTSIKQSVCPSSTWREIRIPVPWGHISGKWWGPEDQRPILATHGWQDNSGTFDTLIPLLPKENSFLAIDFPGCGLSSKLPNGVFYHPVDHLIFIRRIVKYFNWSKVSLLGHSMGAGVNYTYAMFYPQEVDFLIGLDMLKPVAEDKPLDLVSSYVDIFLKADNLRNTNKQPNSYTFKEMEEKLSKSFNSVDLDKCQYILKRNISAIGDGSDEYYFTVDPRLRIFSILDFSQEELLKYSSRMTCPICYCKTDKGQFFEKKEYVFDLLDSIKKHNKDVEVHFVEGTHHLHLNNPVVLENILNNFIKKYDTQDRSSSGLKPENFV